MKEIELLKEYLNYDSNTGTFTWRKAIGPASAGSEAGGLSNGYKRVRIQGKNYYLHRVAWLFVYGDWPQHIVDHINNNKLDNRMSNLRDIDYSGNNLKHPVRRDNSSGYKCIYKHGPGFRVQLKRGGKTISLGTYPSIEEAIKIVNSFREGK